VRYLANPATVANRAWQRVRAETPSIPERLLDLGMEPQRLTPAEFAAFMGSETRKWADMAATSNAKTPRWIEGERGLY
jgi:hypothetical protein